MTFYRSFGEKLRERMVVFKSPRNAAGLAPLSPFQGGVASLASLTLKQGIKNSILFQPKVYLILRNCLNLRWVTPPYQGG